MRVASELQWLSADMVEVDGTRFLVSVEDEVYRSAESSRTQFVLVKRPVMVERLAATADRLEARRIVDIGVFKGGSTALLAALFRPERLTALELAPEPVVALGEFVHDRGLEDVVRPRYGFDQADVENLLAVVDEDHEDHPLDLVVDDASHYYRETRTAFEVLFPRLRPGGLYVIEDWAWSHSPDALRRAGTYFDDRPALTNLAIEILMLLGSDTDLVSELRIYPETLEVERGNRPHDGILRLMSETHNRGRAFRPLL